ncbi:MAG: DMT family transporter [Actinobacteria bacterium]|nr:DMT family transporter [Actinomycetota bacterium]
MSEGKSGFDGVRAQSHTALPTGRDVPLLLGGMIGLGMSGPLIAVSAMPIMVLIFWRNIAGSILMLPFALRARQWRSSAERRAIAWSLLAGVVLALHFVGFFIAMRFTTVAAGTALTALQPLFVAIYVSALGGHIPKRAWIGMTISFIGVLAVTGVDLTISVRAFLGDLAAIGCAALSALYVLIGSRAQSVIATSTYTSICYLTSAFTALPAILLLGDPVFDFPLQQWLILIALIIGAQVMGHTMMNFSLKRVSPTVVSLVIFFEVPLGALFAWWWIDQVPPIGIIPGIVILLVGCALFVTRNDSKVQV